MRGLALIAALTVPSFAVARDVGKFPPGDAREYESDISAELGRCLLGRDRRDAVALVVSADPTSHDSARRRAAQDLVACLHGRRSATLNPVHLSGAIAEALLSENAGALLGEAASQPTVAPVRVANGAGATAVIGCARAADPADAAALLRAGAESAGEGAAFQKMGPSLQACVPEAGSVSLKPQYVRAMIAMATYRQVTRGTRGGVR